jgi:ADP-ribosylglycohydrolase
MNLDLADRIRGVVFGQAVGDALGFGTEFLSRADAGVMYPQGLRSYGQITRFMPGPNWRPGDWTDDTDQMLCILDSLLALRRVDVRDIAGRLRRWALEDGYGMGRTVYAAVHHPAFAEDPHRVAQEYWEASGGKAAANGGVMRTAVLGVWEHADAGRVRQNAEEVCRITHADPRCVGSCVAVCLAVRELLHGAADVAQLVHGVRLRVRCYHPDLEAYFYLAAEDTLDGLDLDEGMNPGEENRLGYTLKALGAGFWALLHADDFADGLLPVIHEAGDADTNAAVAGALLGARFGLSGIDPAWVRGLVHGEALAERADRLVALCAEDLGGEGHAAPA